MLPTKFQVHWPFSSGEDGRQDVEKKDAEKNNFIGFCAQLAEQVAKIVNFTYDICLVKDGKYGEKLDNGTWNGMVGELTHEVSLT